MIYNVFHVEQDTTRKGWGNNVALLEPEKKFEVGDNKEYEVKAIINSAVYDKEANNQMPGLYYLVLWKSYPKKENT